MTYTVYTPLAVGSPRPQYDMAEYLGDGRIYLVRHTGGEARHQTQPGPDGWVYQTKGWPWWAEYEELKADDHHIYRGTDTSMGGGQFYSLYDDDLDYGSRWCPRYWQPGDVFERDPLVVVRRKVVQGEGGPGDCHVIMARHHRTWLRFAAHHTLWNTEAMIRSGDRVWELPDVIHLQWLASPNDTQPLESYYYAKGFGLVAWGSPDRGHSYIAEIYPPFTEQPNSREILTCERPPKPSTLEGLLPTRDDLDLLLKVGRPKMINNRRQSNE